MMFFSAKNRHVTEGRGGGGGLGIVTLVTSFGIKGHSPRAQGVNIFTRGCIYSPGGEYIQHLGEYIHQ